MKRMLLIPLLLFCISCTDDGEGLFSSLLTPCDEPKVDWKIIDQYRELENELYSEYRYFIKLRYKAKKPTCYEYNYGYQGRGFRLGIRRDDQDYWLTQASFTGDNGWTGGEWREITIDFGTCKLEDYLVGNNYIDADEYFEAEFVFAVNEGGSVKTYGKSKTIKKCY
jgi:hypothetical protein